DARQHTFSTQGGGAHDQTAFAVDGASGYRAAGLLGHGQAFAGNQRLVGLALAVDDFAIHREAFAGLDHHDVTQAQGRNGDVFLASFNQAQSAFRAQGFEGTNRRAGLAFGAAFQVFSQQHQGDDHRR